MLKIKKIIVYTVLLFLSVLHISNAAIIPIDPENPKETGWRDENAYRPNPVLFLHGFAAGSNFTWNPDPNARDQAAEQKKATAVLSKWFFDENKYYSDPDRPYALQRWTQFPYLETIEFFDLRDSKCEKIIDRNSSVDRYKTGDYYVEYSKLCIDGLHKRVAGDPGWSDKVSKAITGKPSHSRLEYIPYPTPESYIQNKYKAPTGNPSNVKVNIVAHSMGGLAAREYLTGPAYSGANTTVDRLITTGTANLGSNWASVANGVTAIADNFAILSRLFPRMRWLWLSNPILGGWNNSQPCNRGNRGSRWSRNQSLIQDVRRY